MFQVVLDLFLVVLNKLLILADQLLVLLFKCYILFDEFDFCLLDQFYLRIVLLNQVLYDSKLVLLRVSPVVTQGAIMTGFGFLSRLNGQFGVLRDRALVFIGHLLLQLLNYSIESLVLLN